LGQAFLEPSLDANGQRAAGTIRQNEDLGPPDILRRDFPETRFGDVIEAPWQRTDLHQIVVQLPIHAYQDAQRAPVGRPVVVED
jgi:hypothetical protein